jgi:hypothetical protein
VSHCEALPSNDERLAEAIRGKRVVLGIAGAPEVDPRFPNPPRNPRWPCPATRELTLVSYPGHLGHIPVIDAAAESHGLISSGQEGQVVRVIPMVARVQGVEVPSLGVETVRAASDRVCDSPARTGDCSRCASRTSSAHPGRWHRVAAHGPHDEDRFISASTSCRQGPPRRDPQQGRADRRDRRGVARLQDAPLGEQVPGVEIHAQVVENLFNGVALTRPAFAPRIEARVLALCGFDPHRVHAADERAEGHQPAAGLVCCCSPGGCSLSSTHTC